MHEPPAQPPAEPSVAVAVQILDPAAAAPAYARPGDAGADLVSTVDVALAPGERATVPTGIALALPFGYAGFVHPRSGLADRCGLTIVNAPGTIDAGYRGQVHVTLVNLDPRVPIRIRRGDRIAQLVVQRVEQAGFEVVTELPDSQRGDGGHGSTGGHAALIAVAAAGPSPAADVEDVRPTRGEH